MIRCTRGRGVNVFNTHYAWWWWWFGAASILVGTFQGSMDAALDKASCEPNPSLSTLKSKTDIPPKEVVSDSFLHTLHTEYESRGFAYFPTYSCSSTSATLLNKLLHYSMTFISIPDYTEPAQPKRISTDRLYLPTPILAPYQGHLAPNYKMNKPHLVAQFWNSGSELMRRDYLFRRRHPLRWTRLDTLVCSGNGFMFLFS